jgi:hypothetical protein
MHIGIDPALSGALAVLDTAVRSTLRGVLRAPSAGSQQVQNHRSGEIDAVIAV